MACLPNRGSLLPPACQHWVGGLAAAGQTPAPVILDPTTGATHTAVLALL